MDLGGKDVADLHVVVDFKRLGNDVRSVQFFADDAAADGVSVQTDEEVKEGGAVADDEFLVAVHGA